MKKCYLSKQRLYEANRRIEWQILLWVAQIEVREECPECGCFWVGHDKKTCHGVGTNDDNLFVIRDQCYLRFMEFLRKIVDYSKSSTPKPCPVCATRVSHDWMECLRQANCQCMALLDCNISVRPPLGPEELVPLMVEENENGWVVMKSWMPKFHFWNHATPSHFPSECTHAWETWEERRYPCYKCQGDGIDHVAEECWVTRDREQIKEELQAELDARMEQIGHWLTGNICPVCR